jgi:leader peptidase (prepilin peptidase)/N-methyltransferase
VITIEIAKIVLCITLFLESIIDIKKKQVWIGFPVSASAVGVFCAITEDTLSLQELVLELGITIILGIISKVSKEAIGMGDVWVIGSILLVTGVMEGMGVLFLAFLLAAVYGGVLWIGKRKGKDRMFPFVPFLFLGTVGGVWMG